MVKGRMDVTGLKSEAQQLGFLPPTPLQLIRPRDSQQLCNQFRSALSSKIQESCIHERDMIPCD